MLIVEKSASKIIVALDYADSNEALLLVNRLRPDLCKVKVGKELFTAAGPAFVSELVDRGFDVFLDLKFHDIPNTVAKACQAAAALGVWMLNLHCLGGSRMLEAAMEGLEAQAQRPLVIGVTVLTSMTQEELAAVGVADSLEEEVSRLARIAKLTGLDGVVCSAREVAVLRQQLGNDFLLVTPGIRPASTKSEDDQRRVMTPKDALAAGSSYLVIGRPITQAEDPLLALAQIQESL